MKKSKPKQISTTMISKFSLFFFSSRATENLWKIYRVIFCCGQQFLCGHMLWDVWNIFCD